MFSLFIDAVLSVAIIIATCRMAWLGVHVTLHPPDQGNLPAKNKIKREFWSLAIIASLLVVITTVRSGISQNRLISLIESTRSFGFVQLLREPQFLNTTLEPNKELDINVYFENAGPVPIDAFYGVIVVSLKAVGTDAAALDLSSQKEFREYALQEYKRRLAAHSQGASVGSRDGQWSTARFPALTQTQVDGINNGTQRLYVWAWARWKDAPHDFEKCEWLQPPKNNSLAYSDLVWHVCGP